MTTSTNEAKHQTNNPILRMALHRFFEQVQLLLPDDVTTVIDAGCGEGYAAQQIQRWQPDVKIYGCDLAESALVRAKRVNPALPTCVADVTQPPFPPECADLVISLEVMEHLPDPAQALQAYLRLTRRYVLLSVPNEPIFRTLRMTSGKNIMQWGDHPEHIQHWNLRSFQRFLRLQGVEVIEAASPFPYIWSIVLGQKSA